MRRRFLSHEDLNAYLQDNAVWVSVEGELLQLRRVDEKDRKLVLYYGGQKGAYQLTLKRRLLSLPDKRAKLPQLHLRDDDDELISLYFPKDNACPVLDNHLDGYDDWTDCDD